MLLMKIYCRTNIKDILPGTDTEYEVGCNNLLGSLSYNKPKIFQQAGCDAMR